MKPVHLTIASALALAPLVCSAQIARVELIPFQSVTMSDQDFLNGRTDGEPVTLAGELRIPRPGADKLPAVVLLHGSGGVGTNVVDWGDELNAMGVATFIVDAFTARGIVQTSTQQAALGRL